MIICLISSKIMLSNGATWSLWNRSTRYLSRKLSNQTTRPSNKPTRLATPKALNNSAIRLHRIRSGGLPWPRFCSKHGTFPCAWTPGPFHNDAAGGLPGDSDGFSRLSWPVRMVKQPRSMTILKHFCYNDDELQSKLIGWRLVSWLCGYNERPNGSWWRMVGCGAGELNAEPLIVSKWQFMMA